MEPSQLLTLARQSRDQLRGYYDNLSRQRDALDNLIYEIDRDLLKLDNSIRDLEYEVEHGKA